MSSAIYKFFIQSEKQDPIEPSIVNYICNDCKKTIKALRGTSSNLINHLKRADHKKVKEIYQKAKEELDLIIEDNKSSKKKN